MKNWTFLWPNNFWELTALPPPAPCFPSDYVTVVAVMKMNFPKMEPQVVNYRRYKTFITKLSLDSLRHGLNIQGQFLNEKGSF